MVFSFLARVLRLASIVVCLIAVAWFIAFALDQTSSASERQQAEVNAAGPALPATSTTSSPGKGGEGALHKAIDKVFSTLSSPFAGITNSNSAWTIHIVNTLLVLIIYGFGLAFLARLLRFGL